MLGRSFAHVGVGDAFPQHAGHPGVRLDGDDAARVCGEEPGQRAGAGADVHGNVDGDVARLAQQPRNRVGRWAGPETVVVLGDGAERPCAHRPLIVVHQGPRY